MMRLDKYICKTLGLSRTEAKKIIKKGILVENKLIRDVSIKIDESKDKVYVEGKLLTYNKYVYFMMNKPQNVISATEDNLSRTVIDLLKIEDKILSPFPVGRLDKDTEGLIFLTNDGELAHLLLSPKKNIDKKYYVEVDNRISEKNVIEFYNGIRLEDGYLCKSAQLEIIETTESFSKAFITISEGKFHQIKRMMQAINCKVTYLKRLSIGSLILDNSLELGAYRSLTEKEIKNLNKDCRRD